jgi:hypothetical protein
MTGATSGAGTAYTFDQKKKDKKISNESHKITQKTKD